MLATDGDVLGLVAGLVLVVAVGGACAAIVPREHWRDVLPLVVFATLLRAAVAIVLYDGLLATGNNGFVTGDDATYADLSSRLAMILHGRPAPFDQSSETYLLGTFVYLETAIFFLFGPKVLLVELLNAALGGMLVAFVYDIARRLFTDQKTAIIAAALVAIYPSLVLWSALNLKDALALFLIAIVLWLLVLFHSRHAVWLVPAAFIPLLLMESLRNYIFFALAVVIPASVLIAPGVRIRDRVITSTLAVGLATILLSLHFTGAGALPSGLLGLEVQRVAMGIGAKTSFADAPIVEVRLGNTYVVTTSSGWSQSPGSPQSSPRVVTVLPGTRLEVATAGLGSSTATTDVVFVRPGDVVVVGGPDATAAPVEQRQSLSVPSAGGAMELVSDADSESLWRTVLYLPRGAAYVLFAPFPWAISRALDLVPIPEMIIWYFALAGALIVVIRRRRSWRPLAPLVLFAGGTLVILALAEGNVGTLFRHRAMVIPFMLTLAAPAFGGMLSGGALDFKRFASVPRSALELMRRWPMLTSFVVALAVRLLVVFASGPLRGSDTADYQAAAQALVSGGYATLSRPPMYPLFLVVTQTESMAVWVHAVLGAASAALIASATRRHFGATAALLGGLFVAFEPGILPWTSYLLSETLALALLAVGIEFMSRVVRVPGFWVAAVTGVSAAGMLLTRAAFALPAVVLGVSQLGTRRPVIAAAGFSIGALVLWAALIGGLSASGRSSSTRSAMWETLYDGTQWDERGRGTLGVDIVPRPDLLTVDPAERENYYREQFIHFVVARPLEFADLAVRKALWFWLPAYPEWSLPHKIISASYLIVLYVGTGLGALRFQKVLFSWLLLSLAASVWLTAVLTLVDFDARYRLPAELALAPLAAAGFADLVKMARARLTT